jgi:hypothetical protein
MPSWTISGLAGDGGVDEDVELFHELRDVGAEAHEFDGAGQSEGVGEGVDFALVGFFAEHGGADDLEMGGGEFLPYLGGGREEDVLALPA